MTPGAASQIVLSVDGAIRVLLVMHCLPLALPSIGLILSQSLVEIMVAMAPCARLYGFMGCQLARSPRNRHIASSAAASGRGLDHSYSHWIRTYSSPSFLAMVAKKEAIINKYGAKLPYGVLMCLCLTHL